MSTSCQDTNKNGEHRQNRRNEESGADPIDDFNPSKYNQAKHNSEDDTIHLQIM